MCVIVDANEASPFFQRPVSSIHAPVVRWITERDGRLVYGGKLKAELLRVADARRLVLAWSAAGRALDVDAEAVVAVEQQIERSGLCRSNDAHVIGLALVSGARVLCTQDTPLMEDFRNRELISGPRGNIYRSPDHAHLLKHSSSCGLSRRSGSRSSAGRRRRR